MIKKLGYIACMLMCFVIDAKRVVVVTASYNNKEYYKQNLDSIFAQDHDDWHLVYIDDCSPDGTGKLVQDYIDANGYHDKVTLIINSERKGALANQYEAIVQCKDADIIVIVDGDDALVDPTVLSFINEMYEKHDVWLTYGQFMHMSNHARGFCGPMPQHIVMHNLFRQHQDIPSHLRTFYAGLFKRIKKEDLQMDGKFYSMTGDMAAMIPMIEMASKGHFMFIDCILLIYNDLNSLNDHKISQATQRAIDLHIRRLAVYEPLEFLF